MSKKATPGTPSGPDTDAPFDPIAALIPHVEMDEGPAADDTVPATDPDGPEYEEVQDPDEGDELLDLLGDDDQADEGEEELEDDDDIEEAQGELHTVVVDGETLQVPTEELVKGYSRQADYTRKTQALSEERKQFQAEMEQVRQERQQYQVLLTRLHQKLTSESEPDWEALKQRDPLGYTLAREEWRERKEAIRAAEAEQARLRQQQMAEQQQAMQAHVEEESKKLLEKLPEWQDPEVAKKEQTELVEFATGTLGFSADEVAGVTDHRVLLILRDAHQMHKLRERAAKTKKTGQHRGPAPVRPGTRPQAAPKKRAQKKREAAVGRLRKTGSVDDAASALLTMLDD